MIHNEQKANPAQTEVETKEENPFYNLAFNIFLPVVILNQGSKYFGDQAHGPLISLLFALALPIGYGAYDYYKRRKHNFISILGLINILFTGGFAILKVDGNWFAFKEAFFPLLIGLAVFFSNIFNKPFLKLLFWNDKIFRTNQIQEMIRNNKSEDRFVRLFRTATHLFATSFFLSAILNFYLASQIFIPIDTNLSEVAQNEVLNQQIAQMTWKGYVVIALPMMVFMAGILWFVINGLKKITGLSTDELLILK